MDAKFYRSKATAYRMRRNEIGSRLPLIVDKELERLEKRLDQFDSVRVLQTKIALSVVKKTYDKNTIPPYADLVRIDREFTLFNCPTGGNIHYLSLNNGPGYFDLYIYVLLSYNHSMIAMSEQKYNLTEINATVYSDRTIILAGKTGTGDITQEWSSFMEDFDRIAPDVEFSICSLPETRESQFLYANVFLTLKYLRENCNAVLELPGDRGPLEQTLVYACALCFREISIFKPVTSSLFSRRRYLVCKYYRKQPEVLSLFDLEKITSLDSFSSLDLLISEDFHSWWAIVNGEIDSVIIDQYKDAIKILKGGEVERKRFNQTLIYSSTQLIK
jgi:hypothetical protein